MVAALSATRSNELQLLKNNCRTPPPHSSPVFADDSDQEPSLLCSEPVNSAIEGSVAADW